MGEPAPLDREVTIEGNPEVTKANILRQLETMGGKILNSEGSLIQCDLGSLLKSRLIGEFWVSKGTLPKRVEINIVRDGGDRTILKISVRHRHKYGLMLGYVKKYEEALQEVADDIAASARGEC